MKNVKLFVLALGLFTLNLSAANLNPINPTDDLRIEMVDLIGSNFMDEMMDGAYEADVMFTVNNNKEIIILSVESDNVQLVTYLKRKLNYKKINHRPGEYGEIYLLPVKMVKEL